MWNKMWQLPLDNVLTEFGGFDIFYNTCALAKFLFIDMLAFIHIKHYEILNIEYS